MRDKHAKNSGLVYSCSQGRMCPACAKPLAQCSCKQPTQRPPGDGIVRIGRETKGRKGAGVTLLSGIPLPPEELKALAQQLKKRCGSGGTVKDGVIEIQGDHRELLLEELKKFGWPIKRAGG